MKRIFWPVACLLCFLIGTTFDIDYTKPYYELPGSFRIEQEVLDVYFVYIIPSAGFEKHYPDRWNRWRIGRISE